MRRGKPTSSAICAAAARSVVARFALAGGMLTGGTALELVAWKLRRQRIGVGTLRRDDALATELSRDLLAIHRKIILPGSACALFDPSDDPRASA